MHGPGFSGYAFGFMFSEYIEEKRFGSSLSMYPMGLSSVLDVSVGSEANIPSYTQSSVASKSYIISFQVCIHFDLNKRGQALEVHILILRK